MTKVARFASEVCEPDPVPSPEIDRPENVSVPVNLTFPEVAFAEKHGQALLSALCVGGEVDPACEASRISRTARAARALG